MTRGQKNRNPLNIRLGANWIGSDAAGDDPEFVVFTHYKYGLRAAFVLLRTYLVKHGCRNIDDIIRRWAPDSENDTENYIRFVSKFTQIDRYKRLAIEDKTAFVKIVQAMAVMESQWYFDLPTLFDAYCLVHA